MPVTKSLSDLLGDRCLVFLHIPKTGGTSLHNVLVKHFRPEEICPERLNGLHKWETDDLKDYRFFSGHYNMYSLNSISREKLLITFFREPKSRILSNYYFWKAHKDSVIEKNDLLGPRMAKQLSLLEFLKHKEHGIPGNVDNVLARQLACKNEKTFLQESNNDPQGIVARAKEAVDQFESFGIIEDYDASFRRVLEYLRLPAPDVIPHARNSRSATPEPGLEPIERETITPAIDAELDRLTRFDRQIYAYARKRFQEQVVAQAAT